MKQRVYLYKYIKNGKECSDISTLKANAFIKEAEPDKDTQVNIQPFKPVKFKAHLDM